MCIVRHSEEDTGQPSLDSIMKSPCDWKTALLVGGCLRLSEKALLRLAGHFKARPLASTLTNSSFDSTEDLVILFLVCWPNVVDIFIVVERCWYAMRMSLRLYLFGRGLLSWTSAVVLYIVFRTRNSLVEFSGRNVQKISVTRDWFLIWIWWHHNGLLIVAYNFNPNASGALKSPGAYSLNPSGESPVKIHHATRSF